jgi:molecular chaperone HscB
MLQSTHFELFNLPAAFAIDQSRLDQAYRKLQAEVHPDRFAAAPAAERLRSLQLATQVNEAYQILKSPLARARYLLHLNGIDTREETNTAMPPAFLMRQMEWREAIEEAEQAGDLAALDRLLAELRREWVALTDALQAELDSKHDYPGAAESVRKLRFLDKVQADIEQAIETLELHL